MLRKQLKTLPSTLPQTYERILLNIGEDYSQYALKMLQWLTYSKRPLSLLQLAEVVAVSKDEDPRFDPERRFPEPEDILLICSSLVTATEEDEDAWDSTYLLRKRVGVVKVKLAHFSVQEYLLSTQIMGGKAIKFSIRESDANIRIARGCLSYILYFTEDVLKSATRESNDFWSGFSLARYAVERWVEHARAGGQINEESMLKLIMELFTSDGNAYSSSCLGQFCQCDEIEAPLYYASKNDLLRIVQRLIIMGVDVNASSGYYGNALCVASANGNTEIVKLLLEMGADPNSSKNGWEHGSAVYWASNSGYDAIVRLLLDAGAEVEIEEYTPYVSALHATARFGQANIVAMLISSGVDVNLNAGKPLDSRNTALSLASANRKDEVAKILVEAGADPDSKVVALHIASALGSDEVVKLLLGAGTNIEQGWRMASPLREAVRHVRLTTVKILLDAGADVNLGGSWDKKSFGQFYSTNTLFASFRERRRVVLDFLAAAGAEIIDAEEMMKPVEGEWDSE